MVAQGLTSQSIVKRMRNDTLPTKECTTYHVFIGIQLSDATAVERNLKQTQGIYLDNNGTLKRPLSMFSVFSGYTQLFNYI